MVYTRIYRHISLCTRYEYIIRVPGSRHPGVQCTLSCCNMYCLLCCWCVSCRTAYITPPPGAFFRARLLDNQEGVNTKRYVFGQLSAKSFERRPFWPSTLLINVEISSVENRSRGVWYILYGIRWYNIALSNLLTYRITWYYATICSVGP